MYYYVIWKNRSDDADGIQPFDNANAAANFVKLQIDNGTDIDDITVIHGQKCRLTPKKIVDSWSIN